MLIKKIIRKIKNKTRIKIHTKNGENKINIKHKPITENLNINIYGKNNTITINSNQGCAFNICIGSPDCNIENCNVYIGENVCSNGTFIFLLEDNQNVYIDDDCMFASNTSIWASDTHVITDKEGNITNSAKDIKIGKHCWIGLNASILKNTEIADGSIVGLGSVVSGKFLEQNCTIAGNPAKVIKKDTFWHKVHHKHYQHP